MAVQAAAAAGSKAGSSAAIQAAASAAAPAIGSVFGLIGAKKRMKLQNEMNMQLAKYQNDLNLAQWERENEYNLPANQMARLKEAGINPRMAYGDSASSQASNSPNMVVGEQQAAPNLAQTMQTAFGQFQNVFNSMNQFRMMEAEIENKQAQSKMYESMTNINEITAKLRNLESLIKTVDYHYRDTEKRQGVQAKAWALSSMIGAYYDKYGVDAITYENSKAGSLALPDPRAWEGLEPRNVIDRKVIASQIALANAKAVEAAWNAKNKEFGITFMKRRMQSMNLLDDVQRNLSRLTYARGTNEIDKYNSQVLQRSLMGLQKSLLFEQIKAAEEHNMDFVPFVGNISDYTSGLVGKFGKSSYFRPFYVY